MTLNIDYERMKPYGDHLSDGLMQMSFTLPVPCSQRGMKAAAELATKMGIEQPDIVHCEELLEGFSYFIVYGSCNHTVDYTAIADDDTEQDVMDRHEVELYIEQRIQRSIVVVGASTGTDTHSVGIDAILNMKGFNGHYGLERYRGISVFNLGSQVPNEVLLAKALEVEADAILVSQTVTQQQLHVHNLTQLVDLLEAEGVRDDMLLVCGGPRISQELAKELGYDAGFSKGCYPNHVATFLVREIAQRERETRQLISSPLATEAADAETTVCGPFAD